MLKDGRTEVIKGFKTKTGKGFDAALVKETHRIDFEFAKREQPVASPRNGYYPWDELTEYYELVISKDMR